MFRAFRTDCAGMSSLESHFLLSICSLSTSLSKVISNISFTNIKCPCTLVCACAVCMHDLFWRVSGGRFKEKRRKDGRRKAKDKSQITLHKGFEEKKRNPLMYSQPFPIQTDIIIETWWWKCRWRLTCKNSNVFLCCNISNLCQGKWS